MNDPWKNIKPVVPAQDPDFDQPIIDPAHIPVDIPQEDERFGGTHG
jgi:hypothetical protein